MAIPRARMAGVMLAGGRASRMGGRDKAFAAVGGEPIAVRTVRLFNEIFAQVVIVTQRPERFAGLDAEIVGDRVPGCGPLGGLHAGLLAARHPHVFLAACDMPGLDATVIRFLLARTGSADAVVPCWENDIEPLHAVYAVRCLPVVEECLRGSRHAMRELLPLLRVDYVTEVELRALGRSALSLTNVNTPEELAAVGGRFEDR